MELRHIRHFISVAEHESFTRAAESIHIVQSALSTSVKQLEAELNTELFIRTTRQVRLNAAGKSFYKNAKEIIEKVEKACSDVEAITTLRAGSLSLGTVQSVPPFIELPSLLAEFIKKHPGFDIKLCQGGSEKLNQKIINQKLDLAIMPVDEVEATLASEIIACDDMVLAFAKDSSLISDELKHSGTLKNMAKLPYIDFEPGQGTRKISDLGFSDNKLKRKIAFEVSDLDTLIGLLKNNMGVALLPEEIVKSHSPSLSFINISDANICWELSVVWLEGGESTRAGLNPASDEFTHMLKLAMGV